MWIKTTETKIKHVGQIFETLFISYVVQEECSDYIFNLQMLNLTLREFHVLYLCLVFNQVLPKEF